MRVISGSARRTRLAAPKGESTRPTADRVKEAVFSIIQRRILGAVVLDAFAGSGALGIEALSRGAAHADFVELRRDAFDIVRQNIEKTQLEDRSHVFNTAAEQFLNTTDKKYDIIFLDPPYHRKLCGAALEIIESRNCLSEGGIVVCETAEEESAAAAFTEIKRVKYGGTIITIYERKPAA